jgi:endonuclease YncB( thermonuclease family)
VKFMLVAAALIVGLVLPSTASATHGYDLDCSNFSSQASAQSHLNAHPGDPDGLDGNSDGVACESRPCPCSSARPGATPTPTATIQPFVPTSTPTPTPTATPTAEPPKPKRYKAQVVSVIDGDTVKVRIKRKVKKVRLLGIDSPESKKPGAPVECGALRATAFMKSIALRKKRVRGKRKSVGESVRLTSDPTQGATDAFGRMLAYINRLRDGKDLGALMMRAGWSTAYFDNTPFARLTGYQVHEAAAKAAGKGVWSLCDGNFHSGQGTGQQLPDPVPTPKPYTLPR